MIIVFNERHVKNENNIKSPLAFLQITRHSASSNLLSYHYSSSKLIFLRTSYFREEMRRDSFLARLCFSASVEGYKKDAKQGVDERKEGRKEGRNRVMGNSDRISIPLPACGRGWPRRDRLLIQFSRGTGAEEEEDGKGIAIALTRRTKKRETERERERERMRERGT